MKFKAWAVVNKKWKEAEWKDPFFQQMAAIRNVNIFTYAIFEIKKEAEIYKNLTTRKSDKIVRVTISYEDKNIPNN